MGVDVQNDRTGWSVPPHHSNIQYLDRDRDRDRNEGQEARELEGTSLSPSLPQIPSRIAFRFFVLLQPLLQPRRYHSQNGSSAAPEDDRPLAPLSERALLKVAAYRKHPRRAGSCLLDISFHDVGGPFHPSRPYSAADTPQDII